MNNRKEYERLYRNLKAAQRRYAKKGIEITLPKKVKKPTEASIRRLTTQKADIMHEAQKQARMQRYARQRQQREQEDIPRLELLVINRIRQLVYEGYTRDAWSSFKADAIESLIEEVERKPRSEQVQYVTEWERAIPDLEEKIERFIFDSGESLVDRRGQMQPLWGEIYYALSGRFEYFDYLINEGGDMYE